MAQYQRAIEDGTAATDEIEATCALMFVAGHETTSHFLGNAITALARHPDQLAVAARVGGFTTAHVSELLRFDGSVQNTSRVAATDLTVGDEKIGAGARLLLLLGSANRDEAAFPAGDHLDLDRSTSGHLALGLGPHYREMRRVLRPGGWLILATAFMDPVHERADNTTDYWRFTPRGMTALLRDFSLLYQCEGWGNREALAVVLFGGSRKYTPVEFEPGLLAMTARNELDVPLSVWGVARK